MSTTPEPPAPKYRIRVANKAVIVRDGALLVVTNRDATGTPFLVLPGGGQEWGEDAVEGLRRECREELGCEIVVGELIGVRDYIAGHHDRRGRVERDFHQQENFFACTLLPGQEPCAAPIPDPTQTGFAWLPLANVGTAPLFPEVLRSWLLLDSARRPIYLGDVN